MKTITKQFVLVATGAFLLAGCATTPKTQAWEYKTITTHNYSGDDKLNSLGKDGWILVGYSAVPKSQTGLNDDYHYVFKRLKK